MPLAALVLALVLPVPAAPVLATPVLATPAASGPTSEAPTSGAPTSEAGALQTFIDASAPLCLSAPAATCVEAGWRLVDRDGDDHLSGDELGRLLQTAGDWYEWRRADLNPRERGAIGLGLGLLRAMGPVPLLAGFDTDGDGVVSRPELLADIRLDRRPLGALLADPAAVDRAALAARLGPLGPMLQGLLEAN